MYFLQLCLRLLVSLVIVMLLMILTFKLLGNKIVQINNNKYMKILEKIQISKDNSILIVKVGEKGYVMSSSSGSLQKIDDLSENEIKVLEAQKKEIGQNINGYNENFINIIKKIRGDKHEI